MSLKIGAGVAGIIVAAALWWFAYGARSPVSDPSGSVTIVLSADGYQPREVTIRKGTTVTFRSENDAQHWPASDLHPAHEIYPEFDPGRPLESYETWQFTFDKPGTWGLHDHIRSYYTGVIMVVE